jgi:tetratricopeptide (TPR) repeat protein
MTSDSAASIGVPRRRLHVAGAAVLLGVLSVTHVPPVKRPVRAVLADLACAQQHRIVRPRTSVSAFAPFRAMRGLDRHRSLSPALALEALTIAQPAEPALVDLLLGQWTNAIEQFERTRSARNAADLAAAYYMRGLATDSLLDFCRAFDVLRYGAGTPEAIFNRALVLEQLADVDSAAAEWERYLRNDPSSAWANEARVHLARVRIPIGVRAWLRDKPAILQAALNGDSALLRELVPRYPLAMRQLVELELLGTWGEAVLRRDASAAASALNAAAHIVTHRAARHDALQHDAIEEIRRASTHQTLALARAYVAHADGMKALDAGQNERALTKFGEALALCEDALVFPAIALPNLATAQYRRYALEAFDATIATTRRLYTPHAERYPSLFARLDWLAGLRAIARPDPIEALQFYERALPVYERLGENEFIGAQHINEADSYLFLGEVERAAVHMRKALTLVARAEDPRRLQGLLKLSARVALENGTPEAAVAFQKQLVSAARRTSDPMRLPDALVFGSSILSRAARREEALRDLAEAQVLAPRIEDAPTRLRLQADAETAEAHANRDRDDRRALENLSAALEKYRELKMHAFLVQLLLERGRTHLRLGDAAAAERDYRSGFGILERQRNRVTTASLRISYLDRADRIVTDLAALLLRSGRTEEAFDILERFRARELLDRTSGNAAQPLTAASIRKRLAANTILVTQTAHRDGVMTFVATHDSLRGIESPIPERELAPMIDAIGAAFAHNGPLPADLLRRLGHLLFGAIAAPSESRIVFVPDEMLARVPYAALLQENGRYVIESHVISYAPSATLAATHVETPVRPSTGSRSILIVASRSQPAGTDLPPLTRTVAEAERIVDRYSRSDVLVDRAKAATILQAAGDYDILHFATHAIVDPHIPARSALILDPAERLTAAQIEAADLSNLHLVILGGCNTAIGRSARSEGAFSLIRAFLAASVPSVIGTIAPVTDSDAERILSEFHREYAGHGDAALALREAQLQMLLSGKSSEREPARWSAFLLAGAGSATGGQK